jgi:hypothetical protein
MKESFVIKRIQKVHFSSPIFDYVSNRYFTLDIFQAVRFETYDAAKIHMLSIPDKDGDYFQIDKIFHE